MPLEIERRWLLKEKPAARYLLGEECITQTYVLGLRVRKSDNVYTVTLKRGTGLIRDEQEEIIPDWFGRHLMDQSIYNRIVKHRYELSSGYDYEGAIVDVFEGNLTGLVIMEKEFNSELDAKTWKFPSFLKNLLVREVTNDSRYNNYNLWLSQETPTQI